MEIQGIAAQIRCTVCLGCIHTKSNTLLKAGRVVRRACVRVLVRLFEALYIINSTHCEMSSRVLRCDVLTHHQDNL